MHNSSAQPMHGWLVRWLACGSLACHLCLSRVCWSEKQDSDSLVISWRPISWLYTAAPSVLVFLFPHHMISDAPTRHVKCRNLWSIYSHERFKQCSSLTHAVSNRTGNKIAIHLFIRGGWHCQHQTFSSALFWLSYLGMQRWLMGWWRWWSRGGWWEQTLVDQYRSLMPAIHDESCVFPQNKDHGTQKPPPPLSPDY